MADTIRRGFVVSGQVQGVGFRWWTRRTASQLGLRGTVANLPDGRVEVRVEGPARPVEEMRQLLRRGPTGAHVTAVEEFEVAEPLPDHFDIVGW